MRMWMIEPKLMCNKHLLGEHVETHMFRSVLASKLGVDGYLANNLLEPLALKLRHDALAAEMERRGMNHQSPLEPVSIEHLTGDQQACKVNAEVSYRDLIARCPRCASIRLADQRPGSALITMLVCILFFLLFLREEFTKWYGILARRGWRCSIQTLQQWLPFNKSAGFHGRVHINAYGASVEAEA